MTKGVDVFILCGGLGKRLRRVSGDRPKCLMRVGGNVFLDLILDYMSSFGFRRFILGVGYKADVIKEYYSPKRPGIDILFSREKAPLDTGGAVKKAKKFIKSKIFFVLNGDSFSLFNPEDLIRFHKKKKAKISMLLRRSRDSREYGAVMTNKKSEITCFSEKGARTCGNFINAGVYLFDKKAFSEMPENARFSLEYDFFPALAGRGLYGYKEPGFFVDIGTPKRYSTALPVLTKYAKGLS